MARYLMRQHTKTGLFKDPSLYVLYRHVAGVIQRRSLLGPVVVSQIVSRLRHVLVTFSYFGAPYHFFARFFDYLPLLWRPSYTELLLRQRPSPPKNSISCPLPLVPFAVAADKGKPAFRSSLCIPSFACVIFLHSFDDYASLSSQAVGCSWCSSSSSTL